jgi:hypothetical protein
MECDKRSSAEKAYSLKDWFGNRVLFTQLDLTLKHAATAAEDSISCARNLAAKIRMSKMKHDLKRITEVKTTVKGWSKTRFFYGMTEMLQSLVQIKQEISMVVLKYNENKAENEQVLFPSDREANGIL